MPRTTDELQTIPGVGKSIASDLRDLNIFKVADLKGKNPLTLHEDLCALRGQKIDRCMLYVLRGAIYFATEKSHEPELLKWWNWKERECNES